MKLHFEDDLEYQKTAIDVSETNMAAILNRTASPMRAVYRMD